MPAKDPKTEAERKASRRTSSKAVPETPYEAIKRQVSNLKRRDRALDKERRAVHDKYNEHSDDTHSLTVLVCEMVGLLDKHEIKKVYSFCQATLARDA